MAVFSEKKTENRCKFFKLIVTNAFKNKRKMILLEAFDLYVSI